MDHSDGGGGGGESCEGYISPSLNKNKNGNINYLRKNGRFKLWSRRVLG